MNASLHSAHLATGNIHRSLITQLQTIWILAIKQNNFSYMASWLASYLFQDSKVDRSNIKWFHDKMYP